MAAKIFKSKSIFKALKVGGNYIARYATGRPVIMNLNFNVTNICNQKCPMCNAVITGDPHAEVIKYDKFVEYIDKFVKYGVASMSVSGGEPSLVPRMADYARLCGRQVSVWHQPQHKLICQRKDRY